MLISIVTVSYNSERTIRQTIESLISQTYSDFEYIIIDGKSTDATLDIAHSYEQAFKKKGISYRIVSEQDDGIYDAMNKGIHLCKGDIIGMINSDDWYEQNALEVVDREYQRGPFDLLYANLRIIKQNGAASIKRSKIMKYYVTTRHWNHPTSFISKRVYNRYSYKVEGLYGDFDLFLKIIDHDYVVRVSDVLLANFRMGGASNRRNFSEVRRRIWERYSIYRQNGFSAVYYLECVAIELLKMII